MKSQVLLVSCACAAALGFAARADVGSASEYNHVIHPGSADGSGFWNMNAKWFMYAPAFAFKRVEGAARYRFTALNDRHETAVFESAAPTDPLVPIWSGLPTGYVTVTCDGVDASGNAVGRAGRRTFWKEAGFRAGMYGKAARSYRETALGVYRYIFNMPATQYLLKTGMPDRRYDLNSYISKMFAALIGGMLHYAELEPDARETALTVARAAAAHLLAKSEPAGAPLEFFPPTYDGFGEKGNNAGERYKGQIMLIYPARVASAFLDLAKETGDARYRDAAERIAATYLKLQGDDGTWPLKMRTSDGKPVGSNRLVPIESVTPMFEKLFAATGNRAYRAAADRSLACLEARLADWNWEGQFEDVDPTAKYVNLTKHGACSTAIFLARRFPDEPARRAQVRELLRFAEDQFVCWERPFKGGRYSEKLFGKHGETPDNWETPCALEQYRCYAPIDASAAKMIRTYLAAYGLERHPEDLAKARALGDTATRMQCPDGRLPTWWWPERAKSVQADWLNCMLATANALMQLDEMTKK